MIRLFKSLKYDSENRIDISSYDVASIAYNIFPQWLTVTSGQDLLLLSKARDYIRYLLHNDDYRASIKVPNEMRQVFGDGGATTIGLNQLFVALDELVIEIEGEMSRSLRKLQEARINY